jgi:hypothetical protein
MQIILEIRDDEGAVITREHKIFAEPFKMLDFLNDVLPHWDALIKTMFKVTPEGNYEVKGFKK